MIARYVYPARCDQLGQLRLANCHRLSLTAQPFMPLAFGRNREAQLAQLFGQLFIAEPRCLGRRLQDRLALTCVFEKRALSARFVFQMRHTFRRAMELLLDCGSLPFERVHFAIGSV